MRSIIGDTVHRKERNYHCDHCNKTFGQKDVAKSHMAQVHNDENHTRYCCHLCDKRFYRKNQYVRHIRVHTDERPYSCSICAKAFKESSKLIRHKKHVHNIAKPHECKYCSKPFRKAIKRKHDS